MKNLIVLKFGGSSMGDSVSLGENFPKIAETIRRYKEEYKNVIVVVSALAGETRRLKQIAELLNFSDQNKDKAMSIGESTSSWLLSAYLNQKGIQSKDMNGQNLPIYTNDIAGAADIKRIDNCAIKEELKDNTVIIPGFIGKNSQGNITTLGFDGSDTTAIAVAASMQADRVCLFKDVNGIYSANPRKVAAQHYEKLSLNDMWYFARAGARIVHPKAIEVAMKNDFEIHILPSFTTGKGTLLTNHVEDRDFVGVTYQENKHNESDGKIIVSVVGNTVLEKEAQLKENLEKKQISFLNLDEFSSKKSFSFTLENREQLEMCLETAHSLYKRPQKNEKKASISFNKDQLYFDPALINSGILRLAPLKPRSTKTN